MKKLQYKSIKQRILVAFLGIVLGSSMILSIVGMITAEGALENTAKIHFQEMAGLLGDDIENLLEREWKQLEVIAKSEIIVDPKKTEKEKLNFLNECWKTTNYITMTYVQLDGNGKDTLGANVNIKDRAYFKQAASGKAAVSDPVSSKTTGEKILVYAVPVIQNGKVVGVITALKQGDVLSDYVGKIEIGESGRAYLLNGEGTVIAHYSKDVVNAKENSQEMAKSDPSLQSLAGVELKMIKKETGTDTYTYGGVKKYIGYAPVETTNWSVGIVMTEAEALSELDNFKIEISIAGIIIAILSIGVAMIVSQGLIKPIKRIGATLQVVGEGNLTDDLEQEHVERKDELGQIAKATNKMINHLKGLIRDILSNSHEITEQTAKITTTSEKMVLAGKNISATTQDMAAGASSQADELIVIQETVAMFNDEIQNLLNVVENVDSNIGDIRTMANESKGSMDSMMHSLYQTNAAFKLLNTRIRSLTGRVNEITSITNLINGIAEQTNLLALNAAIEAARAGESGRGFAVVADEIRKLAEQSSISASNINELIVTINHDTQVMVDTTEEVAKELAEEDKNAEVAVTSFGQIVVKVEETTPYMVQVREVAKGVSAQKENIMQKVESVSAIAEEIAASTQEIAVSTDEFAQSTGNIQQALGVLEGMTDEMVQHVNAFKI